MPSLTVTYVSGLSVTDVSGSYPGCLLFGRHLLGKLTMEGIKGRRKIGKWREGKLNRR